MPPRVALLAYLGRQLSYSYIIGSVTVRGRVALCLGTANATARAPGDASVPIKPPSFNLLVASPG